MTTPKLSNTEKLAKAREYLALRERERGPFKWIGHPVVLQAWLRGREAARYGQ